MPGKKATKKQQRLLRFIEQFTKEYNYSPSYREIMHALKLSSVASVAEHVENCVAAGFLKKIPHAARTLEVVPQDKYPETSKLLRAKIKEIEQSIAGLDAEKEAAKIKKAQNSRLVLEKAAKILGIEL